MRFQEQCLQTYHSGQSKALTHTTSCEMQASVYLFREQDWTKLYGN